MSKWKPIDKSEISSDSIVVHKTFNLDNSFSVKSKTLIFLAIDELERKKNNIMQE